MSAAILTSVEEYLATAYRPDCDYVDGVLLERNVGQKDHSNLQGEVYAWFRDRRRSLHLTAFPELRIRVGPTRYRIPDVCVVPKRAWRITHDGHFEVLDGILRTHDGQVVLPISELFTA